MIYIIAIVTGLILGAILSSDESTARRGRYDFASIATSVVGALLGVLFFISFLGIRLTVGFLWLEAILWSLLGALILRLVVGAFTYDRGKQMEEGDRFMTRNERATAHEYDTYDEEDDESGVGETTTKSRRRRKD